MQPFPTVQTEKRFLRLSNGTLPKTAVASMTPLPLLLRQISCCFVLKLPRFRSLHTFTDRFAASNEVHSILETVSPMEDALEVIAPRLSPENVISVIQEQPNSQLGFRFFIWAIKRRRIYSRASRDLVVEKLVKDNAFESYWRTLEELKDSAVSITSDAFLVLIEAYAKVGMAEKAVESFGLMRDFGCMPNIYAYNKVLHIMVEKEVFLLALAVYNQMLKSNCCPDVATYTILIDGFCKTRNTEDAVELFDEMTRRGISPNRITYFVILSGLCQAKRTDDAYRLFNNMKESGRRPDVSTYNALLNGYCKLGKFDEAFELLRFFEKDGYVLGLHDYSCLIDGLFRDRRYAEAHSWYHKLVNENIKADVVLYTIMIRGLSEEGRVADALRLLNEMTQKDLKPDTLCYNAVIKRFCDMGLLDKARSLQLEISKTDSFANTSTYTILICGMCKNGLVDEAQNIFNEMEKLGCLPSVFTFNSLIDGLCKAGKLEDAHLLFYKMEIGRKPSLFLRLSQGSNRVLDTTTLKAMVEQLCEAGLILKAYKLLRQLADSVVPDIRTYNILINGFCKAGNIKVAVKLFKDMQLKGMSPDSVTYGTLIDGLQRDGQEGDAHVVFDQMVKHGCTPSSSVYKSLMTWSCRRRKVSSAFSFWLKYLRSTYGQEEEKVRAVEEHFGKGDIQNAIRGIIEMDFKLRDFDFGPYTIFLIGMCQVERVDEAFEIFSVLKEYRVKVTPPSCVFLITGLCKEGSLDLAMDVFLYTMEKGFMLMPRICDNLLRCLLRSRGWKDRAIDLLQKMQDFGYDLDAYLHQNTKILIPGYWNNMEFNSLLGLPPQELQ